MERKSKAEEPAESHAGKKRKLASSGSDIKTKLKFIEAFGPDYDIEESPRLKMTAWIKECDRDKIRTWLVSHGSSFANLITKIKRNTEPSLYSLLVNALVPVLDLSNHFVEVIDVKKKGLTEEEREEVVEDVVLQSSRQNYFSDADEVADPSMIDPTNTEDVRRFLTLLEETIQSKVFENEGRVELMIHDNELPKSADNVVVIEAKQMVTDNDDEGFFQTAANMVIGSVRYGVYTSHKTWKFLRMDPVTSASPSASTKPSASSAASSQKYIIRHTRLFDLIDSAYTVLCPQAVDVYAHLLEMFNVPNTTDLTASAATATTAMDASAETLTSMISVKK